MPYHLKGKEPLKDAVYEVMRASKGETLHVSDVVDLVRRRRHIEHAASVSAALSMLRKAGLVECPERGYWRWIGGSDNEQGNS